MSTEPIKEIFNELFSHLEKLEAQSSAILQFLKEKKRVTDKQLAPYLEQAENASNVKWRAARARIERLLSDEAERARSGEKNDKQDKKNSSNEQTASPEISHAAEDKDKRENKDKLNKEEAAEQKASESRQATTGDQAQTSNQGRQATATDNKAAHNESAEDTASKEQAAQADGKQKSVDDKPLPAELQQVVQHNNQPQSESKTKDASQSTEAAEKKSGDQEAA